MGLTYNKEYVPRDKRIITSGPRDKQLKQRMKNEGTSNISSELIEPLKEQITSLHDKLTNREINGYTDEQVNNMMEKVVREETKKLNDEIINLKEIIKNKDELIDALRKQDADYNKLTALLSEATKKLRSSGIVTEEHEPGRPKMEEVFVDPTVPTDGMMESHIGIDATPGSEKQQMDDKVNKLKTLLGAKFPKG